jgi:hypothetical protein
MSCRRRSMEGWRRFDQGPVYSVDTSDVVSTCANLGTVGMETLRRSVWIKDSLRDISRLLKLVGGLGEVWSDDGLKLGKSAVAIGRANGAGSAVGIPPHQHCAEYTESTGGLVPDRHKAFIVA